MATRTGICTNIGNCSKADAGEKIQIPVGGSFVCPECNRELNPVGGEAGARRGGVGVFLALVAVVLAILGVAVWFFFLRGHPEAPAPTAQAPAPGPAAPSPAPASTTPPAPAAGQVMLRLQGSNTIGESLAPALAEKFLTAQGAGDVRREAMGADETRVTGTVSGTPQSIEIRAHGSSTAFAALADGSADIGMASRPIRADEKTRLASLGDLTSRASEHVLGLDGLAVIVHPSNPVESLSMDQARDLFTGRVTDWSQVGGAPGPVQLYARDDKSGTFETFRDVVLGGQAIAGSAKRFENSKELSSGVAGDPAGIGFIGLPFIDGAKAVKIAASRGALALRPTVLTVRTEDYPLSRRLFLYTPANPSNPWTRKFVDFALSDPGQSVVDASGFVGQALARQALAATAAEPAAPRTNLPPAYARFTQGAERLPFNFRFRTGSDELDNKAYRDLGRLVQLMSDPDYQSRQVLLFGFADTQGTDAANLTLSKRRAEAVRSALEGEGLRPGVVEGFGEDLPVASNDTADGREKNRRVEIWLRR